MTASLPTTSTPPPVLGSSSEPSLGELVARASRDLSLLIHQEIELAKSELSFSAKNAALGAGLLSGAGVFGLLASVMISVGIAEALHFLGLAVYWSFLVVGGAYLLLAGLLALWAKGRLTRLSPPRRTVRTVKDDVAWARHPTAAPTTRVH